MSEDLKHQSPDPDALRRRGSDSNTPVVLDKSEMTALKSHEIQHLCVGDPCFISSGRAWCCGSMKLAFIMHFSCCTTAIPPIPLLR
jgi:hypothetical protein